jgi:hypothetical protein
VALGVFFYKARKRRRARDRETQPEIEAPSETKPEDTNAPEETEYNFTALRYPEVAGYAGDDSHGPAGGRLGGPIGATVV